MSPKVIAALLKENIQLEASLKQSYISSNQKSENAMILKMKENSKAFFSYAKSKQKTKAKVGPFRDPTTGKINQEPMNTAEVLRKQYDSVFRPT